MKKEIVRNVLYKYPEKEEKMKEEPSVKEVSARQPSTPPPFLSSGLGSVRLSPAHANAQDARTLLLAQDFPPGRSGILWPASSWPRLAPFPFSEVPTGDWRRSHPDEQTPPSFIGR